jgi:hypothetical protein
LLAQEEFLDDARLPADVLDEQFDRAQKFVARHVHDFEPIRHDVLQVEHPAHSSLCAHCAFLAQRHRCSRTAAAPLAAWQMGGECIAPQGWAAKVVQGDLGGRPDVGLAARAMYNAEVNQTKPLWAAWRANDTQFVRYGPM